MLRSALYTHLHICRYDYLLKWICQQEYSNVRQSVRGRNQSASEGKFMGSMAPYGYRAFKLPGEKGNSLRIEAEEAKVVQMIFEMYGKQGMGYTAIAYALNDMHIPARKSDE